MTWGYTPHYFDWFKDKRNDVQRVLEIGICGYRDIPNNVVGASLFVWRDFFPNAEIYGIDSDPRFIFNDQERIHTALADAYDAKSISDALGKWHVHSRFFDFIVDDAVHEPIHQVNLFNDLVPALADDGLYAIEDVCPYKLPCRDVDQMVRLLAGWDNVKVVTTAKPEVLLLVTPKYWPCHGG